MNKVPVLGKIAGFVLTIDPANVRNKLERLEFSDLIEVQKRAVSECEGVPLGPTPRVTISTIYENYDGEREEQEGHDPIRPVGSSAIKTFCRERDCENTVGWSTGYRDSRGSLCISCRQKEAEDADVDVDEFLERQARRDEY